METMAPEPKYALLGMHHELSFRAHARILKGLGYAVEHVETVGDMIRQCTQKEYSVYVMDVNLGHSDSSDISPAQRVYPLVQERIGQQLARFYGISGNSDAVIAARSQGIPAVIINDLADILRQELAD